MGRKTIRDRAIQEALLNILEPIFETTFSLKTVETDLPLRHTCRCRNILSLLIVKLQGSRSNCAAECLPSSPTAGEFSDKATKVSENCIDWRTE
jgi:hypothetical protein